MKKLAVLPIALFASLLFTACDEGPLEEAAESVEDAADETGDALEDAADDATDAVDDVIDD